MPKQARRIEINTVITTVRARELVRDAKARAVIASVGREIAAFGSDAELLRAFAPVGGKIAGTIDLHPDTDSWALGLLYDALTWAISRGRPLLPRLRRKGHAIIVASGLPTDSPERVAARKEKLSHLRQAYSTPLSGTVEGTAIPSAKGCKFGWIAWRIAGGVHSSRLLMLNCLARRPVMGRVMTKAMTTSHLSCAVQIPSWIGSVNDGQDDETRNGHESLRDGRNSCRAVTMVSSKPLASGGLRARAGCGVSTVASDCVEPAKPRP